MLIANFCNGKNKAIVSGAWQYDYGQRLYIHGLELPEVVEIGFSLTETGGMDYPRFAMTKDGVTEVAIPDEMMEGNDVESDYRIYAFVFVEDEKQESGQTVKSIEIRVKSRPKRWMDDETGDNFSEIVKAVRDLVEEYKKSGVSDEQVKAALEDYLADHPIDTLTEDEVRAIVNAMLGDVTQTHFEKVDVLPDDGKENIIYLVPTENTEEQNIYDEYIFLNGIPELIGTTKINLEGYATKEEFRQLSGQKIDSPTVAQIGQTIVVKSVDENGKPTEWEAVDMASGGTQSDWDQNDETAPDYVKNRPFWTEDIKETTLYEGVVYNDSYVEFDLVEEKKYKIIINDIEYEAIAYELDGSIIIGSQTLWRGNDYDETEPPFVLGDNWFYTMLEDEDGEYSLKITADIAEVHTIDEKYLPTNVCKSNEFSPFMFYDLNFIFTDVLDIGELQDTQGTKQYNLTSDKWGEFIKLMESNPHFITNLRGRTVYPQINDWNTYSLEVQANHTNMSSNSKENTHYMVFTRCYWTISYDGEEEIVTIDTTVQKYMSSTVFNMS